MRHCLTPGAMVSPTESASSRSPDRWAGSPEAEGSTPSAAVKSAGMARVNERKEQENE
jgi:hypothetical protein